jgi:hypothetical protein
MYYQFSLVNKNGCILFYVRKVPGAVTWRIHPEGIVIDDRKGKIYLIRFDGKEELLYQTEKRYEWNISPQGNLIIGLCYRNSDSEKSYYELFLDGKFLMKGNWNWWCAHPKGIITRIGDFDEYCRYELNYF